MQTFHGLGSRPRPSVAEPLIHAQRTAPEAVEPSGSAEDGEQIRARLEQAVAHDADRVLAGNTAERDQLLRAGAGRTTTTVVPAAVDPTLFTDSGERRPTGSRPRLVTVTDFGRDRGDEVLLAALRALPDVELVVVGGARAGDAPSPAEERFVAAAQAQGVEGQLTLVGGVPHEEMPALLRSADVVVQTPFRSSFARTTLEAMACGRAVVCTATGAQLDAVVDGMTGLLVRPGRPDQVAAAVRTLLRDPFRRDSYGEAGLDRVRSRYTWERVAEETVSAYELARGVAPEDLDLPDAMTSDEASF